MNYTVLGESFTLDELQDVSSHGANTGWHGFTYSSDLHDKYEEYETQIENALEDVGYTMSQVFADKEFSTLQQYKEWACWSFLELEAHRVVDSHDIAKRHVSSLVS